MPSTFWTQPSLQKAKHKSTRHVHNGAQFSAECTLCRFSCKPNSVKWRKTSIPPSLGTPMATLFLHSFLYSRPPVMKSRPVTAAALWLAFFFFPFVSADFAADSGVSHSKSSNPCVCCGYWFPHWSQCGIVAANTWHWHAVDSKSAAQNSLCADFVWIFFQSMLMRFSLSPIHVVATVIYFRISARECTAKNPPSVSIP